MYRHVEYNYKHIPWQDNGGTRHLLYMASIVGLKVSISE